MKNLSEEIRRYIPIDYRKPDLIVHASLEWVKDFESDQRGYIVISTHRDLTTDGGDGWNGLDAGDMQVIENGLRKYVDAVGAHMIKGFKVRSVRDIVSDLTAKKPH